MWQALTRDTTTYFVPLEQQVGADKVIDVARRLGIRFRYPADSRLAEPPNGRQWGAFTLGVPSTTALDLATAYATLAADGKHCDPTPVQQLTDASGRAVGAASACATAVSPDVARATMDAARCPVGDRPASGDRCGDTKTPATGVRKKIGHQVAGQFGMSSDRADLGLVVASPQLVTAGLIGDGAGLRRPVNETTKSRFIDTVSVVESSGLSPLPANDFAPPSPGLTGR
jgi:membrane peptidoglycan carboxypeptidase